MKGTQLHSTACRDRCTCIRLYDRTMKPIERPESSGSLAAGEVLKLFHRILLYRVVHLHSLVACNRRKLIEKFVHADANAHEVAERFNPDTRATEHRGAILDFGVDGDGR